MPICAYCGCKKQFTSKRKDKRFCSATCKTKDNQLKYEMMPLAICKIAARRGIRLRFEVAEKMVHSLNQTWLSNWFKKIDYCWIDSEWKENSHAD